MDTTVSVCSVNVQDRYTGCIQTVALNLCWISSDLMSPQVHAGKKVVCSCLISAMLLFPLFVMKLLKSSY